MSEPGWESGSVGSWRKRMRRRALGLLGLGAVAATVAGQAADDAQFTRQFRDEDCRFSSTGGNPFFSLRPGRVARFSGEEDGLELRLRITVLHRTRDIRVPELGLVTTRVVEEREWENGELIEVSRNYFAVCAQTKDVYYFGESVDIFEDDGTISHEGAWLAGRNGAMPGIIMPGTFLLGSRYFQELAPRVALDRAEHTAMGLTANTGVGTLRQCVKIVETTPLEAGSRSVKIYCPGVGLVNDDGIVLTDIDDPIGD
jgi:hypothetical protein